MICIVPVFERIMLSNQSRQNLQSESKISYWEYVRPCGFTSKIYQIIATLGKATKATVTCRI
jgi:hypothetical protein